MSGVKPNTKFIVEACYTLCFVFTSLELLSPLWHAPPIAGARMGLPHHCLDNMVPIPLL